MPTSYTPCDAVNRAPPAMVGREAVARVAAYCPELAVVYTSQEAAYVVKQADEIIATLRRGRTV